MKVNEKCDVYSFGVVSLEIITGKHPGDFISSFSSWSSSGSQETMLKDVIDQRVFPPKAKVAGGVINAVKLAFACLSTNPENRPTMRQVSSQLLLEKWLSLTKPFLEIYLKDILVDEIVIG